MITILLDPDVVFTHVPWPPSSLPAIADLALGIGTVIRSTVAGIATIVAILPPVYSVPGLSIWLRRGWPEPLTEHSSASPTIALTCRCPRSRRRAGANAA